MNLFDSLPPTGPPEEAIAPGAVLLRGFARDEAATLMTALAGVTASSPFRHMTTAGGHTMSVAITNCGSYGWVSDETGYRYDEIDPLSDRPWPAMPPEFTQLAIRAATRAGYENFIPDACLINCYVPNARLSLHQDRNEHDLRMPVVSISLGLDAIFLFGGAERTSPTRKFLLEHGDVAVWGGPTRLAFHGVAPLKDGTHPKLGAKRINLTFRRVYA